MIENGRYRNIKRNMRLCQFCNMNMTKNEFHFLLVCTAFRTLRTACFSACYCRRPTITRFRELMTDSRNHTIQNLAKYVYLTLEHRKSSFCCNLLSEKALLNIDSLSINLHCVIVYVHLLPAFIS